MAKSTRLNCWQFKKCGREPGGDKVLTRGLCPVALEIAADGIHNGKNGGRCCWVINNSMIEGGCDSRHGFCLEKSRRCRECDFYLFVEKSEKLLFAA